VSQVNTERLNKKLSDLVRQQLDSNGKRKDKATYTIMKRSLQKLTCYAAETIEKRLLLVMMMMMM
jgi:hypothetical protein